MHTNNFEQINSFFIFMVVGVIISTFFDLFRISRKTFKTSDIITYLEDAVFWIISGIIVLYSIFKFNNGVLRLYLFIGISIGAMIYLLFISKYFIKIGVKFVQMIKKIIHILLLPFRFLLKLIRKLLLKPISFVFINFRKIMTKIVYKLKKTKALNKKLNKKEGISYKM